MSDLEDTCTALGGAFDHTERTCTIERGEWSDGMRESCYGRVAKHLFYDTHGSCYDFQRLPGSTYRERYRFDGECASQVDAFRGVVAGRNGVCESLAFGFGATGGYVAPRAPTVEVPRLRDTRECRGHRSQASCNAALCTWSDGPTHVFGGGADACAAAGGDMRGEDECVVPECRPTQNVSMCKVTVP